MNLPGTDQRIIEVVPGFSPRPVSATEPAQDDSPSGSTDPETHSPDSEGLLGGPILRGQTLETRSEDLSIKDGIVLFGK